MAAKAGAPASDRNVKTDHNGPKPLNQDEKDALFVVHLAQARTDNDELEKAKEIVRGVQKKRTRNRTLCRTDGFPLAEMDGILEDELLPFTDVEDREAKRSNMRRVAGQPGGSSQQALPFDDSFTQKDKDDADWRTAGYIAGLRGLEAKAPPEMAADFLQGWMAGHLDGQTVLINAMRTKAEIDKRGMN